MALSVIGAVASLVQPLLVNRIIDSVGADSALTSLIVGLVAVVLLTSVIGAVQQYLLGRTAESMVRSLRHALLDRLLRLPASAYGRHRTGDLVSRVAADTDSVRTALTGSIVDALGGALIIVGSAAAMIWYDPVLFAVALAVLTGVAITVAAASGKIQELARRVSESTGAMSSGVERALPAIVAVRTAGATESEAASLKVDADRAWRASLRSARLEAFLWPMSGLAIQVAFLMVLGLGGARVAPGELSVANLMAFLMFLFMSMMPIGQLFGAITSVAAALGAVARVDQIMAEPTEDAADSPAPGTAPDLSGAVPAVEFDDVIFSHDEERGHAGHAPGPGVPDSPHDRVLDGVFFAADAGRTTALVGPSGAGKSTILVFIERLHDPQHGVVRVGGADVRDLDRGELGSHIAYVEQSVPVLACTIRSNLTLGLVDADDDRCRGTLASVNLLDRIDAHEDGLDATVADADGIVVVDAGQVRATGTHAELMESSALYRDLARDQLLS